MIATLPRGACSWRFDPAVTVVLHTQRMLRNGPAAGPSPWTYDLDFTILDKELIDKVIQHAKLGQKDCEREGAWCRYKDRIRLAVFVPFLDDKKYSVIEGLPENRHECNYGSERFLVFQALPYRLQFLVGDSQDIKGKVWLRVNSDTREQGKD